MKLNIVFLASKESFSSSERSHIRKIIQNAARHAGKLLDIKGVVNFTVYPFVMYVNGKPWLNGFTKSKEWIELVIPRGKWKKNDLQSTVYHEMHHIVREHSQYRKNKKQSSLIESMLCEGLATAFQIEQVPSYLPGYSKYDVAKLKKWFPKLRKEISSNNYKKSKDFDWDIINRRYMDEYEKLMVKK